MNIQLFAAELEALVIKHGAVLGAPVSLVVDPPIQSVTELGQVIYTRQITPMKIYFGITAFYTDEFKEYRTKNRGLQS